ncbi:class I SAM-dependent methyltransferase [Ilumatobacter nonamiensis]|uniref:class I SAM-dependent methyltransferase n=1 Tax=Ilumatobacter nonamiensis TaxID=467093 RepID=UPI00034646E9|nr:class I SAM-dependent methyltransferase [Ilumatobacter nonamiensis]
MTDTDVPTGNTYDKYGTTNPIERKMMEGFFAALDRFVDGLAPTRILEVGVGEGIVSERLATRFPDAKIVGLDLPDPELAAEWTAQDLMCMFADVVALPAPDDAFDLVVAIEVFEHFDDPPAALRELARVCTSDLLASVPFEPIWRIGNMARGRYLRDLGNTPGHINHWGRRGFTKFVDGEFEVQGVASPLPWTMVHARVR